MDAQSSFMLPSEQAGREVSAGKQALAPRGEFGMIEA
jgi:hypothetical protein